MYCSACGSAVLQNLSYCNRCGAKVGGAGVENTGKAGEPSPNFLVCAIAVVFVIGFAALFGLVALMKEDQGFNPIILAVAMLSFMTMLAVEGVLVWLLLSGRRGAKKAAAERLKESATKELVEARARALPDPLPSVTDHTTRTFDPIPVERESK